MTSAEKAFNAKNEKSANNPKERIEKPDFTEGNQGNEEDGAGTIVPFSFPPSFPSFASVGIPFGFVVKFFM
jgi:hypothetical protein